MLNFYNLPLNESRKGYEMKNYVFLYYSKQDMSNLDEATREASGKAWMAWFEKLGEKVVDAGNPFNVGGKAVDKSGVMDVKDMPATGYSIVKAGSMDEATDMAKTCPLLEAGAVCVYETMPM
jgi:hypothetical protein